VRCAPEVARLLPPGSFFVVAQTPKGVSEMKAGDFREVLESKWSAADIPTPDSDLNVTADPDDLPATLQIPAFGNGQVTDVLVWIVPPAIIRDGGNAVFRNRSPVVKVGYATLAN